MRLNHQRIASPHLVVGRLVEVSFYLAAILVLPAIQGNLSQIEALKLWIRIPDHSRRLFIRGNQHGGHVEVFLNGHAQTIMPGFGLAHALRGNSPRAVVRARVFGRSCDREVGAREGH